MPITVTLASGVKIRLCSRIGTECDEDTTLRLRRPGLHLSGRHVNHEWGEVIIQCSVLNSHRTLMLQNTKKNTDESRNNDMMMMMMTRQQPRHVVGSFFFLFIVRHELSFKSTKSVSTKTKDFFFRYSEILP